MTIPKTPSEETDRMYTRPMLMSESCRGGPTGITAKVNSAGTKAIRGAIGTRTGFLSELGEDFEDIVADLKREQDMIVEAGLWSVPLGDQSGAKAIVKPTTGQKGSGKQPGQNGAGSKSASRLPVPAAPNHV